MGKMMRASVMKPSFIKMPWAQYNIATSIKFIESDISSFRQPDRGFKTKYEREVGEVKMKSSKLNFF